MSYDIFICYSHKDKEFALKLEAALKKYFPPLGLKVPRRRLRIFRDETEAAGTNLPDEIKQALNNSSKLIVLCSPAARQNDTWLNVEINQFIATHSGKDIIPVLIDGIPNTEADRIGKIQEAAFPSGLVAQIQEPWSINFRELQHSSKKINGEKNSWYHLLACIYNVSRSEIEQRERKRKVRQLVMISVFIILLVGAAGFFIQQRKAKRSLEIAERARGLFESDRKELRRAAQLAIEAVKTSPTVQSMDVLKLICNAWFERLSKEPSNVFIEMDSARHYQATSTEFNTSYIKNLETGTSIPLCGHFYPITYFKFSPDGKYLVSFSKEDEMMQVWNSSDGKLLEKFEDKGFGMELRVTFIPDGSGFISNQFDHNLFIQRYANLSSRIEIPETRDFQTLIHPSGKYFVGWASGINSSDTSLIICEASSGKKVGYFEKSMSSFDFITFTNGSSRLICHMSPQVPTVDTTYFVVFDLDENGKMLNSRTFTESDFDYSLLFDGSRNDLDQYALRSEFGARLTNKYPGSVGYYGLGSLFISSDGGNAVGVTNDSIAILINPSTVEIKRKIEEWKFGRIEQVKFSDDGKSIFIMSRNGILAWSIDKQTTMWDLPRDCSDIYLSPDQSDLVVVDRYASTDTVYIYDAKTGSLTKKSNPPVFNFGNVYSKDSTEFYNDVKNISDSISSDALLKIAETRLINCSGDK